MKPHNKYIIEKYANPQKNTGIGIARNPDLVATNISVPKHLAGKSPIVIYKLARDTLCSYHINPQHGVDCQFSWLVIFNRWPFVVLELPEVRYFSENDPHKEVFSGSEYFVIIVPVNIMCLDVL